MRNIIKNYLIRRDLRRLDVEIVAAEQMGRKSYGFEIKKEYVDGFNNQLARDVQTTIFQQESVVKRRQMVIGMEGIE